MDKYTNQGIPKWQQDLHRSQDRLFQESLVATAPTKPEPPVFVGVSTGAAPKESDHIDAWAFIALAAAGVVGWKFFLVTPATTYPTWATALVSFFVASLVYTVVNSGVVRGLFRGVVKLAAGLAVAGLVLYVVAHFGH